MGPWLGGSWHRTCRFCFQTAGCQPQLSICSGGSSSPLVFHCLHGTCPNTCADHTEGGWLGEKARDLSTPTVQKSKVPPRWQAHRSSCHCVESREISENSRMPQRDHTSYCRTGSGFSCHPSCGLFCPAPLFPPGHPYCCHVTLGHRWEK